MHRMGMILKIWCQIMYVTSLQTFQVFIVFVLKVHHSKKKGPPCHEPTESKLRFSKMLENILGQDLSPLGCLLLSTNCFSFRTTSSIVQYLLAARFDFVSLFFKVFKQTFNVNKDVRGISFFVSLSSKTYVPAPHAK